MFAELYHAHHDRHLEDIPFWLNLAAETSGPILELGCGTGRVLLPLAIAGYQTVGLDHDPGMLKFARTHIGSLVQPRPFLAQADISRFSLAKHFPLIILPCNTLSTLDKAQRTGCLACVRRHLTPGGTFTASLPNPELLGHLPARSAPEFEDEFIHPHTGNPVQVSSSWLRTRRSFIVSWIYDQLFPDGTVERVMTKTAHQMASVEEYLDDICAVGLKIKDLYGDFDRSAYTADSPNLIILATNR